jgi:cysteinyl-tRNA synthetase
VGRVVDLAPRQPGQLAMYVCGPTVYDTPHVGHGRFVLIYDVLRRYLEWQGLHVHHVSNVTDIDDKIIDRAHCEGRSWEEVAAEQEKAWWEAMDALGAARPTEAPHATQYVEAMVAAVAELETRGYAYRAADGVYMEVARVEGYGLLARQPLGSLRAGARVEGSADKRSPLDFALWKLARPGEPSWESPWGPGRPGWHTECVVMSLDLLGDGFDLHTGGLDLCFPHHENERAQAVALGRPFARHWMHHGMVETGGQKMSKSLNNFTTLADLLASHGGRAYRLAVLQSHYRKPMEVTAAVMADATRALERLDALARRVAGVELGEADEGARRRCAAAMDDDLDTPAAVGVVFDLVRRANAALDAGRGEEGRCLAATVAHLSSPLGLALGGGADALDEETSSLVARRDRARAERDYTSADALREELMARGWVVEDGPGGTKVRRATGI